MIKNNKIPVDRRCPGRRPTDRAAATQTSFGPERAIRLIYNYYFISERADTQKRLSKTTQVI